MSTDVRRATLGDLPTELICEVLRYVLPEDLENLAGTCRAVATIAQPTLEAHRRLIRRYAVRKITQDTGDSLPNLVQKAAIDPVGQYVIRLECSQLASPRHVDRWSLKTLFPLLPNLIALYLDAHYFHIYKLAQMIEKSSHTDKPFLPRMKEVHLKGTPDEDRYRFQIGCLQPLSSLPSVRHISATGTDSVPQVPIQIDPFSSQITSLDLWDCYINLDHLHRFLPNFTQLQSFAFSSRGGNPAVPNSVMLTVLKDGMLDASMIASALLNCKSTLRRLTLFAASRAVANVGSLTEFRVLEKLQADLPLLPSPDLDEDGVPCLHLPGSLSDLQVIGDRYGAAEYAWTLEMAVSRKSSTRAHLRELKKVFSGTLPYKARTRKSMESLEDPELIARCKSIGIKLNFSNEPRPTAPWKSMEEREAIDHWQSHDSTRTSIFTPFDRANLFPA